MPRLLRSLLCVLLLTASLGCGAGTGGEAVTVDVEVGGVGGAAPFVSDAGWTITLAEAVVAVGPFYLQRNPPPLAQRSALSPRMMFAALSSLLMPAAHAHAGDNQFNGGDVLAELTERVVVDLLEDTPQRFNTLAGIAGTALSFEAQLPPLDVVAGADVLHGHQAFVRGHAEKAGVVIEFAGGASPESDARRRVQGLPVDVVIAAGSTVVISIDPRGWLEAVDFAGLGDGDGDGVVEVAVGKDGRAAAAAWSASLRSSETFGLTVRER